jgi:hypothetical protein
MEYVTHSCDFDFCHIAYLQIQQKVMEDGEDGHCTAVSTENNR